MIVVLSGEGPSDLGQCNNSQGQCQIPELDFGPMSIIADKAMARSLGYSMLEVTPDRYVYLSEHKLAELENARKRNSRSMSLVGKNREPETGYFYINAWMLGLATLELQNRDYCDDKAIAILFRDADGTRAKIKGLWEAKLKSMRAGFKRSALHERGVPMIPKPKSEAWMLCATKPEPYQHCARLEALPGNDTSPNSAKSRLAHALGGNDSAIEQRRWIEDNDFDIDAVSGQMTSFAQFIEDLEKAIASVP